MTGDIREIYEEWAKDPEHNLRHITDSEGHEKLQLRIEQGPFIGILQMELDGRPDGKRPHECKFALEYYETLVKKDKQYRLGRKQCKELFEEATCVYERYSFLLQLSDFDRVIRDTERNMRLFRFVRKFARNKGDQMHLQRWWPYIIRIHATAKAMIELGEGGEDNALELIKAARQEIHDLEAIDEEEFYVEQQNSIEALDELEQQILEQHEPTPQEELQDRLTKALENEEYELAAILRDKLKTLSRQTQ